MAVRGHEAWILTPSSPKGFSLLAPDELAQKTMARIANIPAAIASTKSDSEVPVPLLSNLPLVRGGNPDSFLSPNGFAVRIST